MTDYSELVKALRWNGVEYKGSTMDEDDKQMYLDAADAIEALLKENKELIEDRPEMVEADGHWEWRKPNGEVLMPKRGEWKKWADKHGMTQLVRLVCSECGKDIVVSKENIPNYCPNCGAKMEDA